MSKFATSFFPHKLHLSLVLTNKFSAGFSRVGLLAHVDIPAIDVLELMLAKGMDTAHVYVQSVVVQALELSAI